jgi:REP element-mobilizing transposase RayT
MPRRPRITLAGVPLHLIQRGNTRQACFFYDDDYRTYLNWLQEYAEKSSCAIHAYVLMNNHILCEASHKTCEVPDYVNLKTVHLTFRAF